MIDSPTIQIVCDLRDVIERLHSKYKRQRTELRRLNLVQKTLREGMKMRNPAKEDRWKEIVV